ncbi:putative nucleolar GTP-binding protein [Rosa chinensis]|uniref:Putative nucleolar GTP-binding protein n=1 Tax=Rosa chinensis TaxID=74649 RepID=A0A2P6QFH0_ROSCH|nr:putative nucleolar GTP-binding protein [Rosa chinensis]
MKTLIGQGGEATNDDGVLLTMSTLTEEGVISVKNAACERLLNQRVELKMKSKKINDCLNRFHVAMSKPRDQKERPPCIPQAVLEAELANDEWKEDIIPEILDGHNVFDFVDPDILDRLEELKREEGIMQADVDDDVEMDGMELTPEEQKTLAQIRKNKSLLIQQHINKKSTAVTRPTVPRKFDKDREFTTKRMGRQLSVLGIDPSMAINRARSRSLSRRGQKRERSVDKGDSEVVGVMDMDVDTLNKKLRLMSRPRSRSRSRPPTVVDQKSKALDKARKSVKNRNKNARRGEADRVAPNLKPKHLFSGKRSNGKTQRR